MKQTLLLILALAVCACAPASVAVKGGQTLLGNYAIKLVPDGKAGASVSMFGLGD